MGLADWSGVAAKRSAGILLFRRQGGDVEVLLAHMGGPFWARRETGAWTIPKGEHGADEPPLDAARREFAEETGCVPSGDFVPLGTSRQPSGKTVIAYAVEGDFDLAGFRSNHFEMEWPPKSGRQQQFPEIDRAAWFVIPAARQKISKGQVGFLDQLEGTGSAYNIPGAICLSGELDIPALERSLGELVRRHEVLRTIFVAEHGQPKQVIYKIKAENIKDIKFEGVNPKSVSFQVDGDGDVDVDDLLAVINGWGKCVDCPADFDDDGDIDVDDLLTVINAWGACKP